MIVTLTPNPSVDRTLHLGAFVRGAINRASPATLEAAGKGLNVARALVANGIPAVAVVRVDPAGREAFERLAGGAVRLVMAGAGGPVRHNISLAEPDGTVTKVNEPGAAMSASEADWLLDAAVAEAAGAAWLVGSGALPPGAPPDLYARLISRARRRPGIASPGEGRAAIPRIAVDASGEALAAAVPAGPELIKPNRDELAELVGAPLATLGEVAEAARGLVAGGVGAVLVSLGPDGALYVDGATILYAEHDPIPVVNPVGAGDAMLAGFLAGLARGGSAAAALATAVAWGTVACRTFGTVLGAVPAWGADPVRIRDGFDAERRLRLGAR